MNNTIYMAPMEGLTDFTYRNAYEKTFGKGRITKYFTPFISPNKSENFLARELRDIDREHNKETYTVVQVMTNEAKDFIWTAKMLYEKYGYSEINLNAGCPSGTVVSKDKGSGMLRDTEKLDQFLSLYPLT
ncbi:MAG: diguanylate cyclase, partial [Erysipelotrichaceae bacterium]|nr:diguanylate cyclase [Erysipelotrichaceae bacterium]